MSLAGLHKFAPGYKPPKKPALPENRKADGYPLFDALREQERLFYGRISWDEFHAWGRDGTGEVGRKPKATKDRRYIQLPNGQRLDVRTKGPS